MCDVFLGKKVLDLFNYPTICIQKVDQCLLFFADEMTLMYIFFYSQLNYIKEFTNDNVPSTPDFYTLGTVRTNINIPSALQHFTSEILVVFIMPYLFETLFA